MGRKRTKFTRLNKKRLFLKVVVYSRELKKYLVLYEEDHKLGKTWEPVCRVPQELVAEYRARCKDNNINISKDLATEEADVLLEQVDTVIGLAAGHRPVKRTKLDTDQGQDEEVQYDQGQYDQVQEDPVTDTYVAREEDMPAADATPAVDPDSVVLSREEHEALLARIPKDHEIVLAKDLYTKLKQAMLVYKKAVGTLRGNQDLLWKKYAALLIELDRPVPDPKTILTTNNSPNASPNASPNPHRASEPVAEHGPDPVAEPVMRTPEEPVAKHDADPVHDSNPCSAPASPAPVKVTELPDNMKRHAWDFYHFLDVSVRAEDIIVKRAIMQHLKKVHTDKISTLNVSDETRADMQHMAQVLIFMKETLLNNRQKYDKFLARIERCNMFCAHGGLNTDISALNLAMADSKTTYNPAQKYFVPLHLLGPKPSRAFLIQKKKPVQRPVCSTPIGREVPYSQFVNPTPRSYVPPVGKPFKYSEHDLYSRPPSQWHPDTLYQ